MPSDDPTRPVTPQEHMFLTKYALTGNMVESYRSAGFSHYMARQKAPELLRRPNIKRAYEEIISRPLDEVQANLVRVVRETAHVAFSDVGECFDEEGNILPINLMPENARPAVASVTVKRNYRRSNVGESDLEVTREIKLCSRLVVRQVRFHFEQVEFNHCCHVFSKNRRFQAGTVMKLFFLGAFACSFENFDHCFEFVLVVVRKFASGTMPTVI